MLTTFCEKYSGDPIDFYCLVSPDIMPLESFFVHKCSFNKAVSIKFATLEQQNKIDSVIDNNDISISYITKQCFHRLFIAESFPDIDVAIYIDPDTIIAGDILEFINYPFSSAILAMAENSDKHKRSIVGDKNIYFNNGVYKTYLDFWRQNNLQEMMLEHIAVHGIYRYPEQDLMNKFLSSNLETMPPKFNYFTIFEAFDFYTTEYPNPIIVHFTGPDKPWKNHNQKPRWSNLWRDKYEQIFGRRIEDSDSFNNPYEFDRTWDGFR